MKQLEQRDFRSESIGPALAKMAQYAAPRLGDSCDRSAAAARRRSEAEDGGAKAAVAAGPLVAERVLPDRESLMHVLNARALKCTVILDPAEVAQIVAPDGKPRTVIAIRLPDRRVTADLNAKSVRKAVATISEHGPTAWR